MTDDGNGFVRRAIGWAVALFLFTGVVAAAVMVGNDSVGDADGNVDGETLTVGQPVPIARLAAASDATATASYRMEGTVTGVGATTDKPTTMRITAAYDAATRRMRMDTDGALGVSMILTEADVYAKFGEKWMRTPVGERNRAALDDFGSLSFESVVKKLIEAEQAEITYAGQDELRGTTMTRYLVTGRASAELINGEVWVDGDGRLRRLRIVMNPAGEDTPPVTTDFEVFDIGADVDIELPAESELMTSPVSED